MLNEQQRFIGPGEAQVLGAVLERMGARRIFLVTGRQSFVASGAAATVRPALDGRHVHHYSGFSENPRLADVERGVAAFRGDAFDAVVAVGGGTAIDMAKLVNVLAHQDAPEAAVILGSVPMAARALPLIAMPTTSGSGSEATPFAVVYVDRVKYSVATPVMMPAVAIVDPVLTHTLSPQLTAVTGLDAFAQAIESYWSIHSSDESKSYARQAIGLVLEHLPAAVTSPTTDARSAMSEAAHLAGRAIAETRTTGPHALSYPLTSHLGVPHGQAVCLTLGQFFVYNSEVTDQDVADPRGAQYVRDVMTDLVRMIGAADAADARARVVGFVQEVGLEARLSGLGVPRRELVDLVVSNVNAERMANNPRSLSSDALRQLVQAAY